jgi:predicted amidohydrolase
MNLLLLNSRYRKFHLFGETSFSKTPEAEISILHTDFGVQFGIFSCFNHMFQKLAVQLVKEWGVIDTHSVVFRITISYE